MSQGEYILQKSLSTFEETYRRTPFVARGILFKGSMPSPSLFSLVFNSNQQKLSLWIYKFGSEVLQIQCTLHYHIQYSLKTTRVEFQINHTELSTRPIHIRSSPFHWRTKLRHNEYHLQTNWYFDAMKHYWWLNFEFDLSQYQPRCVASVEIWRELGIPSGVGEEDAVVIHTLDTPTLFRFGTVLLLAPKVLLEDLWPYLIFVTHPTNIFV